MLIKKSGLERLAGIASVMSVLPILSSPGGP